MVVWNGTIIDGHNRYAVIQKHPEIPYKIKEMDFADEWAAIVWMCRNQLGKRNCSDEQKTYLIGKENEALKHTEKFHGNQYVGGAGLEPTTDKGKTAQKVADAHGIGYGTVIRAEKFAKGLDAADAAVPNFKDEVLTGKIKAPKSTIAQIAKLPEPDRKKAVEEIRAGTFKPPTPPKPRKEVDLAEKYLSSNREFKTIYAVPKTLAPFFVTFALKRCPRAALHSPSGWGCRKKDQQKANTTYKISSQNSMARYSTIQQANTAKH